MKHELEYIEDDPQHYGDGLSDFYRCTCGEEFQANGDVTEAFDHGLLVGLGQRDDVISLLNDYGEAKFGAEWWPGNASGVLGPEKANQLDTLGVNQR